TGVALDVTSAGTTGSYVFRANDDGTFTDSTPFVINNDGNVGIGTTTAGGTLTILSANSTGTTTSSATSVSANSLTTGTGLYAASSSLTSGKLVDLQVSGTAAAASQTALNILTAGATATSAITTYGAQISNTHTNVTSGTNVALYLNASGATTANYGLIVNAGNVGIGDTTPSYKLEVNTNVASNYVAQFLNDGDNANRYGIQIQGGAYDASGTTYYINALDGDGGQVGYIANTSGTFALTDVSDIRTKTNIVTAEMNATSILSDLRVVNFNRISDPDGPRITGFIAQEVQEVYPNAVTVGSTGLLGIAKDAFIPVLVKAFQEGDVRLTSAETKLDLIDLKTAENITTLAQLQASVDTELTVVGTTLNQLTTDSQQLTTNNEVQDQNIETLSTNYQLLTTNFANLQLDMNTQTSKLALLETQMQTLIDFYTTFSLDNLIAKDVSGNVDLLDGKLRAKILETGALAIEVIDPLAPTIGTATILPVVTDADNDGIDDDTGADGKSVVVETTAMTETAKIFTNFTKNPGAYSWTDKKKNGSGNYTGFAIHLSTPVTVPVKVDWWIVETK
ncbi:MAG: tail fiber domain-containing protein, partial [Candidatus Moraniibacteriota bacterium]